MEQTGVRVKEMESIQELLREDIELLRSERPENRLKKVEQQCEMVTSQTDEAMRRTAEQQSMLLTIQDQIRDIQM